MEIKAKDGHGGKGTSLLSGRDSATAEERAMPKLGDLLPARERIMEGRDGHGSLLAQQVATLDRLAEGRLILGIGIATDACRTSAPSSTPMPASRTCACAWPATPVRRWNRWRGQARSAAGERRQANRTVAADRVELCSIATAG